MLLNTAAQILQGPGIGLHCALRVGLTGDGQMHAAEDIVTAHRDPLTDLLQVDLMGRRAVLAEGLGHIAIVLKLPLGRGQHQLAALIFGRIAEHLVHHRP